MTNTNTCTCAGCMEARALTAERELAEAKAEAARLRDALSLIYGIGYDHDGYTSAEALGKLVDELGGHAGDALAGRALPRTEEGGE